MNRNRAVAPCGCRVCELRALGPEVVTMLAELLDDIERGGEWPEFMLETHNEHDRQRNGARQHQASAKKKSWQEVPWP